jgi:hypothetical protein
MVLSKYVADDGSRLAGWARRDESHLIHGEEDTSLDRLQAVTDIGQRARHDYGHGVVEEGLAHLVLDVDWYYGILGGHRR